MVSCGFNILTSCKNFKAIFFYAVAQALFWFVFWFFSLWNTHSSSEVNFPWRLSILFKKRKKLEKENVMKKEDTILFNRICLQWLAEGKPHKMWLLFSLRMKSSHFTDTCCTAPNLSLTLKITSARSDCSSIVFFRSVVWTYSWNSISTDFHTTS